MNNQKAFLICITFVIIFNLLPANWLKTADFEFHFNKSTSCEYAINDPIELIRCQSYYPLLHYLGGFFSFDERPFLYFLFILLLVITPLLLFLITKNWITTWFYFSTTQFVYLIQTGGAYPQLLATIFLLLFMLTKNNYARIGLLLIGLLSHSQAFFLLTTYWFLELLFIQLNKIDFKHIIPACSAIFGKTETEPIPKIENVEVLNRNGIQIIHLNIKDFLNFFIRIFPLPFLILSFYQIKKEKKWHLIAMTILLLYYGIAVGQSRVFWTIPIILIPSLTNYYANQTGWWKKSIIGLSIITFLINFGTWLLYKINCIPI